MAAAKPPAEDTPSEETTEVASGKVAKYVGTADVREIDAAAWRNIGVEDQGKVVWSKANRWQVPVADLTPQAVNYLDKGDDGFVIADAEVK